MSLLHDQPSPNFDARPAGIAPEILVLHYTDTESLAESLGILLDPAKQVSAHYLIDEDGTIYRLVAEEMRAWHAGKASWRGLTDINARSIGIELQNPGHRCGYRAFAAPQIEAAIALCREIAERHKIGARDLVAHSDIAPARKKDPGELFPWDRLAMAGLGYWPGHVARRRRTIRDFGPGDADDAVAFVQRDLAEIGYACPQTGTLDPATSDVLCAFQRRYRPWRIDGRLDGETHARARALRELINC
jgi:N-acetylmuramoyl-L-alanine amidase